MNRGAGSTPRLTNDDERNWTALRYVLGELDPAECEAWETRLATEEACCAAVAEATLFALNLQQACPVSPVVVAVPVSVHPAERSTSRAGAACAAMLAAAACFLVLVQSPRPSVEDEQIIRLVALWRQQVVPSVTATADLDEDLALPGSEDRIPGWLLAAVSLEERQRAAGDANEVWEEN
jgi:hypothetical protein